MADITPHPFSALINGGLRSIAASIPVCSSLGQAWNEFETFRTIKRIEELLENLKTELLDMKSAVEENKASIQDCQDFPELLEITIDKVRKEVSESKRAKQARLLARFTIEGAKRSYEEKVTSLENLEHLSELDLKVLQLFKGKAEASVGDLDWPTLGLCGDQNQQLWQLACCLVRIESRGLILNKTHYPSGVVYNRQGMDKNAARFYESEFMFLPLGKTLIQTLFD